MNLELLDEMRTVLARGETCVLGTLIEARGSTPQEAGASLLLRADGSTLGTLGGGCIEAEAVEASREVLRNGRGRVLDFELTEDIAVDYGLACGGSERIALAAFAPGPVEDALRVLRDAAARAQSAAFVMALDGDRVTVVAAVCEGTVSGDAGGMDTAFSSAAHDVLSVVHPRPALRAHSGLELYVEPVGPPAEVVIVGGGHVGRAVATAAKFLGYRIVVIDDREDFANTARFPDADDVIAGDIEQAITTHVSSPSSAVVIVTRGHKYDYQALDAALRTPAFYVGLMGSRRKVALIYRQLLRDGISPERLRDVRAPIGLNIGAMTPEEIAISIMAEITKERLGGDGAPMKVDERILEAARSLAGG